MKSRRATNRVLCLAMLVGASSLGAESLKETIDLALVHDASIASATQGAQASRLEAGSAVRAALPSLGLGGSYQYNSATADVTLPVGPGVTKTLNLSQQNTIDMNAGVRWLPFTGFAQEAGIEQKRLQAVLADNSLDSTRTEVALRAITAFRQAQAAKLQIETLGSASRRAQLQLDETQALERQGMAKKVDVLSLTIARLDYDQKLIAAKAGLADALEQLKFLTGKGIDVPSTPEEEPRLSLPPLDEAGLSQIKALAIQRGILETNRTLARSKFYPTVALSGALHYGLPGVNPVQNQWMVYGVAAATVTWSFDWGGDELEAQATDHNIVKLANDEKTAREQIELGYNSALRDWNATREALNVGKASLDLAQTKMGIVKSQYEQGMASTTDFNDANLELTQAELQYRTELLSLLLKANQIDALSGESLGQWSVAQ